MNVLKLTIIMSIVLAISGCRADQDIQRIAELEREKAAAEESIELYERGQWLSSKRELALKTELAAWKNPAVTEAMVSLRGKPPIDEAYTVQSLKPDRDSMCWRTVDIMRGTGLPKNYEGLPYDQQVTYADDCYKTEPIELRDLVRQALHNFSKLGITSFGVGHMNTRTMSVNGILQTYHPVFLRDNPFTHEFRRQQIAKIYADKTKLLDLYAWLMPAVGEVFRELDQSEQRAYMEILQYAEDYVRSDRLDADITWLEKLERGECDLSMRRYRPYGERKGDEHHECTQLFAHMREGDTDKVDFSDLRKVEAWIVRRIHFDGMSRDVLTMLLEQAGGAMFSAMPLSR